ncbi:MAG: polysaccharide deacetylase family protein, partial [Terriglobia bacterium]
MPDPLFPDLPDAIRFDRILRWMKSWFNVLPLDEAARSLVAGTLPDRPAAITFDDGYADNFTVALPALLKHQLAATFFIATGFLDGGRMWNDTIIEAIRRCPLPTIDLGSLGLGMYPVTTPSDRSTAIDALIGHGKYLPAAERAAFAEGIAAKTALTLPSDLMMTSSQVQDLRRAGMQIGAHTVSHPMLTRLTLHDARDEIAASKAQLERMLGECVELFAYPNGKPGSDYTE